MWKRIWKWLTRTFKSVEIIDTVWSVATTWKLWVSAAIGIIAAAWAWIEDQPPVWIALAGLVGAAAALWIWNGITWRAHQSRPQENADVDKTSIHISKASACEKNEIQQQTQKEIDSLIEQNTHFAAEIRANERTASEQLTEHFAQPYLNAAQRLRQDRQNNLDRIDRLRKQLQESD